MLLYNNKYLLNFLVLEISYPNSLALIQIQNKGEQILFFNYDKIIYFNVTLLDQIVADSKTTHSDVSLSGPLDSDIRRQRSAIRLRSQQ